MAKRAENYDVVVIGAGQAGLTMGYFLAGRALAAAISTGVFAHASKHGNSHATAWGIVAFLAAGVAVPVYFIRHWMRRGARV